MPYEIELKFPLDDPEQVVSKLVKLQAEEGELIEQRDRYFNHPSRDFAETDEALRIRTAGKENKVTYKGPLLDGQTKTRHEIEIPLGSGTENAARFAEILSLLGFREVRTVQKTRRLYRVVWEDRPIEIAFDAVVGLGNFIEIETTTGEPGRRAAGESILRLAQKLELDGAIRTSYLALLLKKDVTL